MLDKLKTGTLDKIPMTRVKLFIARILYLLLHIVLLKNNHIIRRKGVFYQVDLSEGVDLSLFLFGNFQNHITSRKYFSLNADAIVFDVHGSSRPPYRNQMLQAPSVPTMHGPMGVSGVQRVPNKGQSAGTARAVSTSAHRQPGIFSSPVSPFTSNRFLASNCSNSLRSTIPESGMFPMPRQPTSADWKTISMSACAASFPVSDTARG